MDYFILHPSDWAAISACLAPIIIISSSAPAVARCLTFTDIPSCYASPNKNRNSKITTQSLLALPWWKKKKHVLDTSPRLITLLDFKGAAYKTQLVKPKFCFVQNWWRPLCVLQLPVCCPGWPCIKVHTHKSPLPPSPRNCWLPPVLDTASASNK